MVKMGLKPLYIIKFVGGPYDGFYYSGSHRWQGVPKEKADQLNHKDVRKIQGHLKRPGIECATIIEPVKN